MQITAEKLMLVGGIATFVLTLYWVRSRQLLEKYAVMWVLVALVVLLCGIPDAIKTVAEHSRLGYATAVLYVSLAAIYFFSFTVSVSLSRQYRRNIRLTQELAIVEQRLRTLEEQVRSRGGAQVMMK